MRERRRRLGAMRLFSSCLKKKSSKIPSNEPQTDWKSLFIVSIICFFTTVQISLYVTSLWPYLQQVSTNLHLCFPQLDKSITESFLGIIQGLTGLGTAIANPLFGYWMNRLDGSARIPLITGLIITTIGNLAYLLVAILPFNVGWTMLVARFITGVGGGFFLCSKTLPRFHCRHKNVRNCGKYTKRSSQSNFSQHGSFLHWHYGWTRYFLQ